MRASPCPTYVRVTRQAAFARNTARPPKRRYATDVAKRAADTLRMAANLVVRAADSVGMAADLVVSAADSVGIGRGRCRQGCRQCRNGPRTLSSGPPTVSE